MGVVSRRLGRVAVMMGVMLLVHAAGALAQEAVVVDSLPPDTATVRAPSPGGAFLRSLLVPGWGQAASGAPLSDQLDLVSREFYLANVLQDIPDISNMAQLVEFTTEIAGLRQAVPAFL